MKPVRLQRSRKKGFHLKSPNGLPIVYIGRPSKWGNKYREGMPHPIHGWSLSRYEAVQLYKLDMLRNNKEELYPFDNDSLDEIRNCNLACFCPVDEPCHGDPLLKFINSKRNRK